MKSIIRHRIIKHKRKFLCDYNGNCKNLAFKEIYPNLGKENEKHYWCYLCKKHFEKERKRLQGKLIYCDVKNPVLKQGMCLGS